MTEEIGVAVGGGRMKAIVGRAHGRPDVLKLEEIDRPSIGDDGMLIRVHASSINPVDFFLLSPVGYAVRRLSEGLRRKPLVLGVDFAGTVESVGPRVTDFKPGDEVFGGANGAFAEYVSVPATGAVVRRAAGLTLEQAAAVPVAGLTALQALRDHGRVRKGQKVVINGASGGVGSFAVQIAKAFGARVTAVCSPRNVETARALGADLVIDYTKEDFTRGGERYDLVLDIAGNRSWSEYKRVLAPTATLVAVGGSAHTVWGGNRTLRHLLGMRLASIRGARKLALFIAKLNKEDLLVLQKLIEDGKVTPVIDRRYELNQVPEALTYMGEGHAQGKIVVRV